MRWWSPSRPRSTGRPNGSGGPPGLGASRCWPGFRDVPVHTWRNRDRGQVPGALTAFADADPRPTRRSVDLYGLLSDPASTGAGLLEGLERRALLKRGYTTCVSQEEDYHLRYQLGTKFTPDRAQKIERAIAEECGCDPDYIVGDLVKIENSLFKSASTLLEEDRFLFLIERKDGTIAEIDSFSTLTSTGKPRTVFYLFCPEEHRQRVQERAGEIIAGTLG